MSWSDPTANLSFSVGEVVTAAKMNLIRDDLIDLDRRTTSSGAKVDTSQSTTSATFTDLTTSGPAVTVTIGSTGKAMIDIFSSLNNNTTGQGAVMGFAVSGATTVAAGDDYAISYSVAAANSGANLGAPFLLSTLTAGANTFTSKYHCTASGTATFQYRKIILTPLGS